MKRKGKRRKRNAGGPGIILVLFFLIIIGAGALIWHFVNRDDSAEEFVDPQRMEAGIAYIRSLEAKDASEVESAVKTSHGAAAKIDMDAEDFNVWSCFGDIVLMGDSRTKEFSHSELIEERRVLAEDGTSILSISDYYDSLRDLNPSYVILQYGINDMENIDVWQNSDVYGQDLIAKIQRLKEVIPNATIFVQTIFPVIEPEYSRLECRAEIPAWNEVIKEYCAENGIPVMDLAYLAGEYPEYYEPDGMHFTVPFYKYWAEAMIAEVQKYEGY